MPLFRAIGQNRSFGVCANRKSLTWRPEDLLDKPLIRVNARYEYTEPRICHVPWVFPVFFGHFKLGVVLGIERLWERTRAKVTGEANLGAGQGTTVSI